MMKHSFYGYLIGTALLALPMAAAAQTVAELKPTGQWLVNSAGLQGLASAGEGVKAPCIMANQFNNGFILRLSGGGEQLLSLSLDFRQNAFTQGEVYPAVVSVDGGSSYSLMATAFSPGILIIGAAEAPGLYQAVQSGRSLALNVVGNTIIFSLENVRDGLQRLESCYSPPSMHSHQDTTKIATAAPIPTVPDTEVYVKRESYPEFKQPTAQDLLKAETAPPETKTAKAAAPAMPSADTMASMPPLTEAEMAELNLTPDDLAPAGAPGMKLAQAKPASVPVPDAVPKVEAQPISPPPVNPVAQVEPAAITPPVPLAVTPPVPAAVSAPQPAAVVSPQPKEVAAVSPPPGKAIDAPRLSEMPATPKPAAGQWEAKAGEDIRVVLARWSERAGADLVWEADGGGKIARDMNVNGSFEDAVAQVMADNAAAMGIRGQFAQGDSLRPVSPQQTATRAPTPITGPNGGSWSANKGDDLKTVLQVWAAQNDVDLKWQADERFALAQPIEEQGDFASAIEAALVQFDEQAVRPVGQLNRDPATGKMSLTIQTDRAS